MSRVPCPKCATPLDDDQEVCSYCRRRRDPSELAAARAPSVSNSSFSVEAAVWGALLLLGAAALLRWRAPIAAGIRTAVVAASIAAGLASGGGRPAPAPSAAAPVPAPPAGAADCRPAGPARRPQAPDESHRLVYGVVYDLMTGCAVRGARVAMLDEGSLTGVGAATDADGNYQLSFLRAWDNERLTITVDAPGYRGGQLLDADPPYRSRPPAERRAAAAAATDRDLEPEPLRFGPGEDLIADDLVVLPAR